MIQLSHEVVRVVPCNVGWCRAVVVVVLCWWVQADTTLSVTSTLLAGGRSEVAGGQVGGRLVQYSANIISILYRNPRRFLSMVYVGPLG